MSGSRVTRVLIVAGSDSGGGAGVQADIKTVTMLGGHAMTAITAITAQNTLGVEAVMAVPAEMVVAQMRAVIDDLGVDAVKIGMIGSAATAEAVAEVLEAIDVPVVFDPVMVATSGSVLADEATVAAFGRLMRLATLVTPNLPELAALGGEAAVRARMREGGAALLVKGGHAEDRGAGDRVIDRLIERDGEREWSDPRIDTRHSHGTGCTLASAIATGLGRGMALDEAVAMARTFVRIALHEAPGIGGGNGPMGHGAVRLDVPAGPTPNQVTLPADDVAASVAFYRALGLRRIVASGDRYARFESAGGVTLSVEAADEVATPTVFIECGDLDGAIERLRNAGHVVEDAVDERWGWREALATDPAGNAIRLYRAGENRRFPAWRLACPD